MVNRILDFFYKIFYFFLKAWGVKKKNPRISNGCCGGQKERRMQKKGAD